MIPALARNLPFILLTSWAVAANATALDDLETANQQDPIAPLDRKPKVSLRRNIVYGTVQISAASENEPAKVKRLLADVYRGPGDGPFPAAIVIHGGSWTTGSKAQMGAHAKRLAANGYVAVAINYRLAPRYRFPAQIEDCWRAYAWMVDKASELEIDANNIAAVGYSAGGHLACLMGTTDPQAWGIDRSLPPIKAVVAGGTPSNLEIIPPDKSILTHWLGGTRYEIPHVYRKASPIRAVNGGDAPVFLYHGSRDAIVPCRLSRQMVDQLQRHDVPVEYYECEGKGHVRTFFDQEAAQRALAFLDRNLQVDKIADRTTTSARVK